MTTKSIIETTFHLTQNGLAYLGSFRIKRGVWLTELMAGDQTLELEAGVSYTFSLDGELGSSEFVFKVDEDGNLVHAYPDDSVFLKAIDQTKSVPVDGNAHIYFNLAEVEIDPGNYRGQYKTSLVKRNNDGSLDWISNSAGAVQKFVAIVGLTFFISNEASAGLSFFSSRIVEGKVAPTDEFNFCASTHKDSPDRLVIQTSVVMADRGSSEMVVSGYPQKIKADEAVTVIRGLGVRVSS